MQEPLSYMRRVLAAVALVLGASCGSSDERAQGTEGGACYANGTCNAGLECASNLCVVTSGTGCTEGQEFTCACSSGVQSTQRCTAAGTLGPCACAGDGDGGAAPNGGSGAMPSNGGTPTVGGASPTGATGGVGQTGGTGAVGGADCGDTMTDRNNCGACGNVCSGDCSQGVCVSQWSDCLTGGFDTCGQYCASFGEACAECDGWIVRGWGADGFCETNDGSHLGQGGTCDSALVWTAYPWARCCCTNTQ